MEVEAEVAAAVVEAEVAAAVVEAVNQPPINNPRRLLSPNKIVIITM